MHKLIYLFTMVTMLSGCGGDILVKIPNREFQNLKILAQVQVNDSRDPGLAISSREGLSGTPLGNISFDPPPIVMIKSFLETELNEILSEEKVQSRQDYVCDIIEFGVNTNVTLTYWDVIGRIHLILKHEGKEYNLFGTSTIRTYMWPGEGIISKVIDESFKQIAVNMKQVL